MAEFDRSGQENYLKSRGGNLTTQNGEIIKTSNEWVTVVNGRGQINKIGCALSKEVGGRTSDRICYGDLVWRL